MDWLSWASGFLSGLAVFPAAYVGLWLAAWWQSRSSAGG